MTTTRAPFLAQSYGAYDHRDVPPEDAPLTHTGPGTPCGEYMRRFWQPVIFSDDLKDLPIPLKILGEELVAFRDKSGNVGLMELHCPHRGTSLEFGILCDHGIRCCYHGWQMDVDGKILGHPRRAPRQHSQRPAVPWGLPGPRVQRHRLRLHGASRSDATLPPCSTAIAGPDSV